jgi:hypothetical protein
MASVRENKIRPRQVENVGEEIDGLAPQATFAPLHPEVFHGR